MKPPSQRKIKAHAKYVEMCIQAILSSPPKEKGYIYLKQAVGERAPEGWPLSRITKRDDKWILRRYNADTLLNYFYEQGLANISASKVRKNKHWCIVQMGAYTSDFAINHLLRGIENV